jgi:hypothetical protein
MSEPDLDAVQRIARATCAQMHAHHLAVGRIVRPRRDPGQYRAKQVYPVIFNALATGLIKEVQQ